MHFVSRQIGKSVNNCMTYYLAVYKQSDDYRLLKVICEQERRDKETAMLEIKGACQICDEGGNLLICDTCEAGYHMNCLSPPLMTIPEGNWDCDSCLNEKLLEVTKKLLRDTGLIGMGCLRAGRKKRKADDLHPKDTLAKCIKPAIVTSSPMSDVKLPNEERNDFCTKSDQKDENSVHADGYNNEALLMALKQANQKLVASIQHAKTIK